MASSSVQWYGAQVTRAVRERMKVRLGLAARLVAQRIRENIGTPGPPHSVPGEFPHTVSGELLRSVGVETDKRSLTVRVVVTAPYAGYVEEKRSFIRRTLREMRSELRRIILGNSGGGGRYKFTE